MEYIWIWPICAMAAAVIAKHKGRSPVGWFCVGLLAGVFALLVAVLPSREAEAEREARMHGTAGDFRRCPVCAEAIRAAAQKCRYCQSEVGAIELSPVPDIARSKEEYQRNLAMLGTRWQERPRGASQERNRHA